MAASTSTLKIIIRALDEFSGELNKLNGMMSGVAAEVKKVDVQAQKGTAALQGMAQTATGFQQLGIRLAAVGAAITASVVIPIKAAAEFERALSRVVAVTEGAQVAFAALTRTASELGRTTRYTATEAAQGMRYLGMAGFDAAETMQAIGPALELAAAGQMSLAQAADISTNIMTAMRVPVEELAHVVDVLAKTSTSSNTSVMQMADALKYTAPLAQSAGVTLEATAAAIGVLGNNGIQASLAGTSLRGMLLSLGAPTKKARDTLAALGVVIARNQDGTIDFIRTLERLRDSNITLAESNALFLRRSAAGALALAHQVEEVKHLNAANIDAVRSGTEMYQLMEGNLIGATILLSSAFNGLLRSIGRPLLNSIENFVRGLAATLSEVAGAITEFPNLTRVITYTTAAVGLLIGAIGALSIAMTAWIQIQRAAILLDFVRHWKLYTLAVKEATVATYAFFASTTKITVITAAVSGLLAKLATLGKYLIQAFKSASLLSAIVTFGSILVTYAASIILFAKSTNKLIDAQKKLGAELSKHKKQLLDLSKAMKANKNDEDALAETTLKLRTYMLHVAETTGSLRVYALALANSIDILEGKFTDGEEALRAYRTELEKQKFETMAKQVRLYADALKAAQGDTAWTGFNRGLDRIWARSKDIYYVIDRVGGLLGDLTDYSGDLTKAQDIQTRMQREHMKLFAREALAAFEQMGRLDPSWTQGELVGILEALGVTYQDAVDLYINEFKKFQEAHRKANGAMLEDSVFKDDATVQHYKEAVNEQIKDLNRLKREQIKAVAGKSTGVLDDLLVEIDAAQDSLSDAMEKYDEAILNRRIQDAEKSMVKLREVQKEYKEFRAETDAMAEAGAKTSILTERGLKSGELYKEKVDSAREANKQLDLIRQENLSKVIKEEEERTQVIERNEKLKVISSEEADRQRLASTIETAKGRLGVFAEELTRAVKIFGPKNPAVVAYAKTWLNALDVVKDARKKAMDYELEMMNKHAGELSKAVAKGEKARLQATPDTIQKFRDLAEGEIKEIERTYGEKIKSGEKFEKARQVQIKKFSKQEAAYNAKEQTKENKQTVKNLKAKIATLKKTSEEYLSVKESYDQLLLDIAAKYKLKELEHIKKQDEKKTRAILERLRAELEEKKKLFDEELSESEYRYQEGEISLEQHYDNRRRIISEKIDAEIDLLMAKLKAAKTKEEELTITAQIKVKRTEETVRLGKEDRGEAKAIIANERAIQNALIDIRRKSLSDWEYVEKSAIEKKAFDVRQKQEKDAFERRYQENFMDATVWAQKLTAFKKGQATELANFERQQLLDLESEKLDREAQEISFEAALIPGEDIESTLANERDARINSLNQQLIDYQNFTKDEGAILDMYLKIKRAKEQAQADYEKKLLQQKLQQSAGFFGNMSDMFGGLYEASGKKMKAFAKLQKATAVGQTIISTYAAAQKAYEDMLMAGGPWAIPMAIAAAAAAIAQGMARVYAIQSQPVAAGGKIEERPDFEQKVKLGKKYVPIKITAKEWKFSKERVKQYGPELFDALRERKIPKDITEEMFGRRRSSGQSVGGQDYGEVTGFSPHRKADNIETYARPGDYVLPVDAAQEYGKEFLQALSQGKIPTDWMELLLERRKGGYGKGGTVKPYGDSARRPFPRKLLTWVSDQPQEYSDGGEVGRGKDQIQYGKERIRKYVPVKWIDLIYEKGPTIQKVVRQPRQYSSGGEVDGVSPQPKAGNIPILETAEDWVVPVKAGGKKVMSAIEDGLAPTEVLKALKLPTINIPSPPVRYAYASGGPVMATPASQPTKDDPLPRAMRTSTKKSQQEIPEEKEEIAIYNVIDPRDMDRWAASSSGSRAILNIISSRSTSVRRILR